MGRGRRQGRLAGGLARRAEIDLQIDNLTMTFLVLNGSPRKNGNVATLLRAVVDGVGDRHEVEWIDVYDLNIEPCLGCMKCRPDGQCCLADDDAHVVGRKINEADGLIVGTPTYWGNMSAPLKTLFDRIVPSLVGQRSSGSLIARHEGKPAIIATACTAPWPLNFLLPESRGAVRAVKSILRWSGYRVKGVLVQPGAKVHPNVSVRLIERAKRLGGRL